MKKILIVNANYYNNISTNLIIGARKELNNYKKNLKIINVPGVFEIPFTIKKYIKKFDGFLALGCVIKGKTPHFDLICKSTFDALIYLSIDNNKPVCNGIITSYNMGQAIERSSINKKNSKPNKGIESARALISIFNNEPK